MISNHTGQADSQTECRLRLLFPFSSPVSVFKKNQKTLNRYRSVLGVGIQGFEAAHDLLLRPDDGHSDLLQIPGVGGGVEGSRVGEGSKEGGGTGGRKTEALASVEVTWLPINDSHGAGYWYWSWSWHCLSVAESLTQELHFPQGHRRRFSQRSVRSGRADR